MANQVLTKSQTPTLDWADVASAAEYWAQVAADPRFASITQQKTALATSTWTLASSLTDGQKYYWRFRTRTGTGYTADQTHTTASGSGNALRDAAARTGLGQSFVPDYSLPLARVALKLKKTGSPTGNLWVEIWSDAPGAPSAQMLSDSATVDVSTLTGSYASVNFDFATPVPLVAGTTYWIVLQGDNTINGTDYAEWEHSGSNSYSDGVPVKHDAVVAWTTNGTSDHLFTTYYQGTWSAWSPVWSFWVDTAAQVAFTPSYHATNSPQIKWAFIDPDVTTDYYEFAVTPQYEVLAEQVQRGSDRNLKGDRLTEYVAERATIQLTFDRAYVPYTQRAEIDRFASKRKAVYLVMMTNNRQDVVEQIYLVEFEDAPEWRPLAFGREDYFRGQMTLKEAALA